MSCGIAGCLLEVVMALKLGVLPDTELHLKVHWSDLVTDALWAAHKKKFDPAKQLLVSQSCVSH